MTERVELEKLPLLKESAPAERPDLFIKKLQQCQVIFDFKDALSDLKGKEIKRNTLHEVVEYVSTNRGVVTDAVYPVVIQMVSCSLILSHTSFPYRVSVIPRYRFVIFASLTV